MCIIRRNLFVGANKMVSVSELSIGGVVDGPSVRRLKDAQRLGLYQPDAEAEREPARGGATLNQRRTPEPGRPHRQSSVGLGATAFLAYSPAQSGNGRLPFLSPQTKETAKWHLEIKPPALRIISSGAKWQLLLLDSNQGPSD